ncbi:hypothetical protein QBC43DRAFT_312711 [Cladorrhinum sp. PSN259]|nr:hypothetical protein QBC43DRAFT_312711 [Cladorrhinum sp. PSN259]
MSEEGNRELSTEETALVWLSVAQRPFRARELWLAIQICSPQSTHSVEQLLVQGQHLDEQDALSSLQALLPEAITFRHDTSNPNVIYVEFSDRYHQENPNPNTTTAIAQAHAYVATVSMTICHFTVMNLARIHEDTAASSLTLYAWTHWSTHFRISGQTLKDEVWSNVFEAMVRQTCSDALVFLLALNDFVTEPITLSVIQDQARCNALVKEAQEALETPIFLLSSLMKTEEVAKKLQGSREIFEASQSTRPSGFSSHFPSSQKPEDRRLDIKEGGTELQREALVVDRYLFHTLPLFEQGEAQTIRRLVDAARGLRSLCPTIVKSPLYEELLKEFAEHSSPLDLLANAADLLETVGTYPYWDKLPLSSKPTSTPLGQATTDKSNTNADILVSTLLRNDSRPPPHLPIKGKHTESEPFSQILTAQASLPLLKTISPLRYRFARIVYKIRGLISPSSSSRLIGATFTINPFRRPHLSRTSSSFSALPSTLSTLDSFLPTAFYTAFLPRLERIRSRISPLFDSVDNFASAAFTGGISANWPLLKRSFLSKGYRTAFCYFGISIIANHVRGMLVPWLGGYLWYYPLDNLRLANTNPDVFLEVMFNFSWWWVVFMWAQKMCWDFSVGVGMGLLVLREQGEASQETSAPDDGTTQTPPETAAAALAKTPTWERILDVCRVVYLTWLFSVLGFMLSRGVHCVAWLLAFGKLLFGGDAEHIALGNTLRDNWLKVPFIIWQIGGYTKSALIPLVWASVFCALLGQPGLLIVVSGTVGGVWAIIKYRSTFYMALEVSGMFVVGGFLAFTIVMLGLEFWDDPLGVKLGTVMARRRGLKVRAELSQEAQMRIDILKRKETKSSPVVTGPPPSVNRAAVSLGGGEKRD